MSGRSTPRGSSRSWHAPAERRRPLNAAPLPEPAPLIAARWRPIASAVVPACALVVLVLGLIVHRHHTTRFDTRVLAWLYEHVTGVWVRVTIDAATPAVSVGLLAIVFVLALHANRPKLAVVAVLAPTIASIVTRFVVKPWVDRPYGTMHFSLAYPSGHETLVASAAVVVALAAGQVSGHRLGRTLLVLLLVVWTAVAGVGLVVNFWHYTTDVLGAVALSVAVVLGVALLADRVSSPDAADRPSTARAV